MSRTPLARVLSRAYAVARRAHATGEPLDEAIARANAARDASRRRFLRLVHRCDDARLAQAPGGGQARDAGADDHHVLVLRRRIQRQMAA